MTRLLHSVLIVRLRRSALALLTVFGISAFGCTEADADAVATEAPVVAVAAPAPTPEALRADLQERANVLWQARRDEDWAVVYSFRDPRTNTVTEDEFTAWAPDNEPFVVHSFTVEDAVIDGETGWVDLVNSTSVRQFPQVPPQTTNRVEIWSLHEGVWYPVPDKQLELHPVTPKQRDAAAERALSARFETMWNARADHDVKTLWNLTHPGKRPAEIPHGAQAPFQMISRDVAWVEVVGDRGRVFVTYRVKVNDESMERLPPQDVSVTEDWALFQGEWFLGP